MMGCAVVDGRMTSLTSWAIWNALWRRLERRHTTIYTYDRDNRMTALIYDGDVQKVSYITGALGQLIRVNDPHENATWIYCYEDSGNTPIRTVPPYRYTGYSSRQAWGKSSMMRSLELTL